MPKSTRHHAETVAIVSEMATAAAQINPVTALLSGLLSVPREYRRRRWETFVNELLDAWDGELDLLANALSEDRVASLLDHASRVAERSRSDAKIRMAAQVLAAVVAGTVDQTRLDHAEIVLSMLDGLDSHHMVALGLLGAEREVPGAQGAERRIEAWTMSDLTEASGLGEITPLAVAGLLSAGLARDDGAKSATYGGLGRHQLVLTDAGAWLLKRLNQASSAS